MLGIWLKEVPEYSAVFLRLILCVTILDAVANPFMISAQATGRVKVYQSVVGGILLTILPVAYVVLKSGGNPQSVFIVHLTICIVAFIVRLLIIRPMIRLSVTRYFKEVVARCLAAGICAVSVSFAVNAMLDNSLSSSIAVCCVSVMAAAVFSFLIGMKGNERNTILDKIKVKF